MTLTGKASVSPASSRSCYSSDVLLEIMKLHSEFRSDKMGKKNCIWLGLLALVVIITGVYFFFLKHAGIMNHREGPNEKTRFNITVSPNGDGDFRTISDAIQAAPSRSSARFFIRVSSGVYNEIVAVPQDKVNLVLVGDGAEVTRVTASRSEPQYPTSDTATFGKCTFLGCVFSL